MKKSIIAFTHRKDLLTLGILIVITVAVRLPGVFNRAIWYDEAITLLETAGNAIPQWSRSPAPASTQKKLLVGSPNLSELTAGLRETDVHPPAYYALLSLWRRAAGGSLEIARLFSVLWSIASVVLFYLLLRASGFGRPLVPSLVYSLTSGAVHYSHEARNYSFALFLILLAFYFAYLSTTVFNTNRRHFWIFSLAMSLSCSLAFLTNYLSIFLVLFLLLWYTLWLPKTKRVQALPAIIVALGISLIGFSTLAAQLGARPKQFQKELGIFQELYKIIKFNFEMLWKPVVSNTGVQIAVLGTIVVLVFAGSLYVKNAWEMVDKRLFTMMAGLALAPSAGVLGLDLVFSKSLGKSSYVFFAGPAIVYLLTMAFEAVADREPEHSHTPAVRWRHAVATVIPFFVGLQLTGINFDLERTPGFAGSTLRSLAQRIEASASPPVVVIGAGHGRGDPATVIYELQPETTVCVLYRNSDVAKLSSELENFDDIWIVFAKGRATSAIESSLVETVRSKAGYRVASRSARVAHLSRRSRTPKRG